MSDLIRRQDAIKKCQYRLYESALNNIGYECKADEVFSDIAQNRIQTWLEDVPSVQPERKPGRWLRTDAYPHRIYCSACFATFIRNDEFLRLDDIPHDYCPNCGCKMEVENDTD